MTNNHGINMISVLIVSCDTFVSRGLLYYLENTPGISVVNQLHSTCLLVHTVLQQQPNIVLIHTPSMDSHMTEMCKQLESLQLPTKCIFLLSSDDHNQYLIAINAGAKGVLCYNSINSEELIKVIHHIHSGEPFIAPTVAYQIIKELCKPEGESAQPISKDSLIGLTQREMDILSLLSVGSNNRDIAEKLYIEVKTVKNHLTNIYSKLNVRSRAEAIAIYYNDNVSKQID